MRYVFQIAFLLTAICSMLPGCSYHNIEDIDPGIGTNECDTSRVILYSADIVPIMINSCGVNNTCHMSGSSDSNIPLGDIRTLRNLASDGSLMGAINHNSGYEPMPEAGSKLPDCSIHLIQIWINQGTLNN